MNTAPFILSINGSDSTGQSGIQADIQTIAALGGQALTAITAIGLPACSLPLAPKVVVEQVSSIIGSAHPRAIKVGLVTDGETIRLLRDEVIASSRLVVAPGIFDSEGKQMVGDEVVEAVARYLIPEAMLLMLRCKDAEKLLGISIQTDDDMLEAARQLREMGAEWVLLRGARHTKGRLTALLYGNSPSKSSLQKDHINYSSLKEEAGKGTFFTSYNTEGWQRHGVAAALSAAITTRLGMGDDVPTAIRNAHDFIHSQVVYAKDNEARNERAIDLYNAFISLVAGHYREAHDVIFYADKLCITTRYLSQVTDKTVAKSPKQIIADYLLSEAQSYLDTTRLSIQEIAYKLGFTSGALFCKFFKHQNGTSPSDYRNRSVR